MCVYVCVCVETSFTMQSKLALNSEQSSCLNIWDSRCEPPHSIYVCHFEEAFDGSGEKAKQHTGSTHCKLAAHTHPGSFLVSKHFNTRSSSKVMPRFLDLREGRTPNSYTHHPACTLTSSHTC